MKKLFVSLALLVSFIANAHEIKIADFSQYQLWGTAAVSPEFAVNPELGRAWVELKISANDPDGGLDEVQRVKVAGLSFDQTSGSINLDSEGRITTCALITTRGRSIFRHQVIKHTNCKFEGRWRKVSYDDGYEIKHTQKYGIFLVVNE